MKDNIMKEKEVKSRNRDNFLIKQRAFIKLYLLSWIEQGRPYGQEMLDDFYKTFKHFNYKPNHSEVYKGLHELLDDGIITRSRIIKEGSRRQELKVYEIANKDEARRYKKQVKEDLDRSIGLLNKAVRDNYV